MPRILLVDDDPAILRLLEVNFRMEGFDVDTAGHGEEALAAASNATPDVVILDLMMPNLDGFVLIETLAQALCYSSDDKLEGTTAFLEKRKAKFTGR